MWGAIKKAINSTLGEQRFKPLDRFAEYITRKLYYDIVSTVKAIDGNSNNIIVHPDRAGGSVVQNQQYKNSTAKEVVLPNSTILIGNNAFESSSIQKITIPNNVVALSQSCFLNCSNLEKVVFEKGSKITVIGDGAFANCSSLKVIALPDIQNNDGAEIYSTIFANCTQLTTIYVPWSRGASVGRYAPWGAPNASIVYDWNGDFDSLTDLVFGS